MKITPIELLSPAKDVEVGIAAINHGADAVYIGGPAFGAREKAGNSMEDIERLCRHAALFDAKVYVTLNTLLYDSELEQACRLAYDCWNAGVDALIIQDMALLQMDLPPIPLHASTQCDNMTVEKVKFLEDIGFSQVVLGRELSIDQILAIRRQTTVPLEFFVHGSLCVSHSGQCYLSHYIGNRSANRGACAQPCRLPWELVTSPSLREGGRGVGHLCLKDLNNRDHLEELMDAGVTSFKIEGRLKDADYVKNITAFYRQKIDAILERRREYTNASFGHCSYDFELNPSKSFNRGFTDYFIHGRQPNIGSPDTPKSKGEYVGTVKWCNSVQMEVQTSNESPDGLPALHNGDGLCFLNSDGEWVGIRADVVRPGRNAADLNTATVVCNRPHGATRGTRVFRNYDIEWQKQVEASKGNRKIDIALTLTETDTGYELQSQLPTVNCQLSTAHCPLPTAKISANNPEKAMENIRKKVMQWGDTVFNPVSLELHLTQPYLIPASVLGELKRGLLVRLTESLVARHRDSRATRKPKQETSQVLYPESELTYRGNVSNHLAEEFYRQHGVTVVEEALEKSFSKAPGLVLMTTHHCIRYANGMCFKEHPSYTGPLYLRHDNQVFRLEFDCNQCVMKVISV